MDGFQDVTLSWQGVEYVVPANDQMRLIAVIEDALMDSTGTPAVAVLSRRGGPSQSRLSVAYAAALRHAGAKVSDQEVYLTLQADIADQNLEIQTKIQVATLGLLAILSPPMMSKISAIMETPSVEKQQAPLTE